MTIYGAMLVLAVAALALVLDPIPDPSPRERWTRNGNVWSVWRQA